MAKIIAEFVQTPSGPWLTANGKKAATVEELAKKLGVPITEIVITKPPPLKGPRSTMAEGRNFNVFDPSKDDSE